VTQLGYADARLVRGHMAPDALAIWTAAIEVDGLEE
jgi:hypothetical protein